MSWIQAVVLGLLQGVTELFPISSLGHSVLLPPVLGWHLDLDPNTFLTFLVATHFATALVLFVIYAPDWVRIVRGLARSVRRPTSADPDGRLGWLLILGTVPAGIVGLALERPLRQLFVSPRVVAGVLILNGVLLWCAERLRRHAALDASGDPDRRIAATLTVRGAGSVGLLQILALVPGFSRTGATIAGGLLAGLAHEDALRFSFLLATPIIGAAAVLKLPHLLHAGSGMLAAAAAGAVAAALAAYLSVRFLTRHFRTKTLVPFAIYCLLAGAFALVRLGV